MGYLKLFRFGALYGGGCAGTLYGGGCAGTPYGGAGGRYGFCGGWADLKPVFVDGLVNSMGGAGGSIVLRLLIQTEHLLTFCVKKPAFRVSGFGFLNMA